MLLSGRRQSPGKPLLLLPPAGAYGLVLVPISTVPTMGRLTVQHAPWLFCDIVMRYW